MPDDLFTSTDSIRSGKPLKHGQTFDLDEPLALTLGGRLDKVTVAYETYGRLNAARDNAVLICPALTGDSHVARHDADDDPGWWDAVVGPGGYIDTDRCFVICANLLGGCRGTTGPASINPATGRPYGPDFPAITLGDIVRAQKRLVDHLGIERLRGVLGASLGGHQALTWATQYPDRLAHCIAIATCARLTNQALAFDVVGRNAILTDPHYHAGQHYDQPTSPDVGLAIARMLGHITYLSAEAMDAKFDPVRNQPRDIQTAFEKRFGVGSYLAHQGDRFTERFDANSYLVLSMAMDLFDMGRTPQQLRQTLSAATCDFTVLSFSSDWLFPPRQSRQIVQALTHLGKPVTYCEITTDAGHDGFLLEPEIARYGPLLYAKLVERVVQPVPDRPDEQRIAQLIEPDAGVLDLGCGDGELLAMLAHVNADRKLCGVEVAQNHIINTVMRGFDVIDYDLNHGLPGFDDQQFDYVVLSATLQAVDNVERLFDEMLRVGRRAIISFANFAYRPMRHMLSRDGRVPRLPGPYDYAWYNSPNRRFPTIADVQDFCRLKGITINRAIYLETTHRREIDADDQPNLNADTAIFVISR